MSSILSVTNVFDKELKRKHRWTLKFLNVPVFNDTDPLGSDPTTNNPDIDSDGSVSRVLQLSLLTAARPSISLEEVEFHRLNEKFYYPGKVTYEPIEVSFYDHIELGTGRLVYDWMRAIYDPKTGAMGYKKFFQAEGRLFMLDPKGIVVEEWVLVNCFPNTVNFNDLSYEDTGAAMINATIRFDRAFKFDYRDPMAGFNPATDTEGFAGDPYGVPGQTDFNQGMNGVVSDFPGP